MSAARPHPRRVQSGPGVPARRRSHFSCSRLALYVARARNADRVVALDSSGAALERAARNCELNGITNVELVEANAFDYLKDAERARERFDTIVLDPPAFAKSRAALPAASAEASRPWTNRCRRGPRSPAA